MNITEANDLNTLLNYVLSEHATGDAYDVARDAAERLADRAHKVLQAGWTGAATAEAFELLDLPGCYGCPDCDDHEPERPVVDVLVAGGVL